MKTVIVQDWLTELGGAEKVLESIHKLYPSPIYTLVHNPKNFQGTFLENQEVHTSFIQKLPFAKRKYRAYLPLFPLAIEQFDFSEYEVIISSSYAVAKGVLSKTHQLHICYCHSPVRYAWDLYHQYIQETKLNKGIKGFVVKCVLHYLRMWDVSTVNRVDHFIANSQFIANRIKKIYNREATVIYPPVDTSAFELLEQKEDFYLTASRFVPYKKIDIIVEAFAQMPNKKLVVIGTGPELKKIRQKAKNHKNIELLGYQPFEVLKDYMQRAKAFVFAAEEDFGITPVEAQACGTPVIAFGKGGTLETVIENETGVFFDKQTPSDIMKAVEIFENQQFDYKYIHQHAKKFDEKVFEKKFKQFFEDKYTEFYQNKRSKD